MKLLLDTQILLWIGKEPEKVSGEARRLISNTRNRLFFSAISIWEIAFKQSLKKPGFNVPALPARTRLLSIDFKEVALTGLHGAAGEALPPIHGDPFDRILIAQAQIEGMTFLTSDALLAKYPGRIIQV